VTILCFSVGSMSKPTLYRVQTPSPLRPITDVRHWYFGKHIIAHTLKNDVIEINESGNIQHLKAQKILFLHGETGDIIITNEESGKIVIYKLENSILKPVFDIAGQVLSEAHLAIDRILVLVVDGYVYGIDLEQKQIAKSMLLGFSIPSDARTYVHSHYFYAWTRSALYRVDLLQEPLSSLTVPTPIKVSLNPPLELEQEICMVADNSMVVWSPVSLGVYDITGQCFFEKRLEYLARIVLLKNTLFGACAFILGDRLYYLKNHKIESLEIHPENISSLLFLGDEAFVFAWGDLHSIHDIDLTKPLNSKKGILLCTPTKFCAIGQAEIEIYALGNFAKIPSTYCLGSWPRRSTGLCSDLFKPFLYQSGRCTFVWRLEDGAIPEIRLHTVDFNGLGPKISCYSVSQLVEGRVTDVTWKASQDYVVLQISNKVIVFEATTGKAMVSIMVEEGCNIKDFHQYGDRNLWFLSGPSFGVQITKVMHFYLGLNRSTTMDANLLGITATASFCHPTDGNLIVLDPVHHKISTIFPPEHPERLNPKTYDNVYAVAQKDSLYAVIDNEIKMYSKGEFVDIMNVGNLKMGEILQLYIGNNKTVIIGSEGYCFGKLGKEESFKFFDMSKGNRDDQLRVLFDRTDPEDRTVIIYTPFFMWPVEEVHNVYRTPRLNGTGLENAIIIAPGHLVQGFTSYQTGPFFDKVDNNLISFVI
jgi:hypothetical protein